MMVSLFQNRRNREVLGWIFLLYALYFACALQKKNYFVVNGGEIRDCQLRFQPNEEAMKEIAFFLFFLSCFLTHPIISLLAHFRTTEDHNGSSKEWGHHLKKSWMKYPKHLAELRGGGKHKLSHSLFFLLTKLKASSITVGQNSARKIRDESQKIGVFSRL